MTLNEKGGGDSTCWGWGPKEGEVPAPKKKASFFLVVGEKWERVQLSPERGSKKKPPGSKNRSGKRKGTGKSGRC